MLGTGTKDNNIESSKVFLTENRGMWLLSQTLFNSIDF